MPYLLSFVHTNCPTNATCFRFMDNQLPDEIVAYRPFLQSVVDIFSDRELKLILAQADRQTLKVLVVNTCACL